VKKLLLSFWLCFSILSFSEEEYWLTPKLKENIIYRGKMPLKNYVLFKEIGKIYVKPSFKSRAIGRARRYVKLKTFASLRGEKYKDSNLWHKVKLKSGAIGYVHDYYASKKKFRYDSMISSILKLDEFLKDSLEMGKKIAKVAAYKPGSKPAKDAPLDIYGRRGEQSAMAYFNDFEGEKNLRYLEDSRIVAVPNITEEKIKEEETILWGIGRDKKIQNQPKEVKVSIPDSHYKYTIDKSKLSYYPKITKTIDRVIVIDKTNQLQGAFKKEGNHWELQSASYVATGLDDGGDYYETPSGYFIVSNLVDEVLFKDEDEFGNFDWSRSAYGVRFSGGGYIHGIPVADREKADEKRLITLRENALGTKAYTHKCIRNPQNHALFLFNDFIGYRESDKDKRFKLTKNQVAVIIID